MLHTDAKLKRCGCKLNLPVSQFCPVNPAQQVHMYPGSLSISVQVPPFLQSVSLHDSSAVEIKKKLPAIQLLMHILRHCGPN